MHLKEASLQELTIYLQSLNFIGQNAEVLSATIPGEGNMNYTLRINTDEGSLIVKQANAYVQKYPQIPAPPQRVLAEATFYLTIKNNKMVAEMMPQFIGVDAQNFILGIQDLGNAKDATSLYKKEDCLSVNEIEKLCNYLNELHNNFKKKEENELMANRELRTLNHEHIFVYPFMEDNGFDLDNIQVGLQKIALIYKKDESLKQKAFALGKKYMADGDTLLHGDFYPGSWLKTGEVIKVIDPEFCFYGSGEFDLGVMQGHFYLAGEEKTIIEKQMEFYKKPQSFDEELYQQFTGIEIIRRLIGLAQLPLSLNLYEKKNLLQMATKMI